LNDGECEEWSIDKDAYTLLYSKQKIKAIYSRFQAILKEEEKNKNKY
jgi:hypothetical protein